MAKRVATKIGDIFSVKMENNKIKYFQLIAFDQTQLNSDVIRAFKKQYTIDHKPDLPEIINDEVDFYAHCITKLGVKMNLWEKVGSISEVGEINNILFRGSNDSGVKVGGDTIKVSHRWYIWHINDKDFTRVGKLVGENRKAELGVVVNPYDVIDRLKTGTYNFFYPDFE
ncbi:hypothetical protein [Sphingobacterium sp.]|uniref:hypothetical protein n=1 Tax=Sphingobacterium sp. TaxID=341027 RepID=UPI0028980BAE|nr:hypothetical protein [Sphingobacterium sp.]